LLPGRVKTPPRLQNTRLDDDLGRPRIAAPFPGVDPRESPTERDFIGPRSSWQGSAEVDKSGSGKARRSPHRLNGYEVPQARREGPHVCVPWKSWDARAGKTSKRYAARSARDAA
jgi:hypothetical protein